MNKVKDSKWSKRIKAEFFGVCCICGHKGNDAHHLFERGILVLRYIIKNGIFVCFKCHRKIEEMTEEENKKFIIKYIGEYKYQEFEKMRKGMRENNGEFQEVN
jgi:hypothetical protein